MHIFINDVFTFYYTLISIINFFIVLLLLSFVSATFCNNRGTRKASFYKLYPCMKKILTFKR